jgi:hypothetical protein
MNPWCAVTKGGPSREAARVSLLAALLQRVRVPSRQASEHRVAGPNRAGAIPTVERGVERVYGPSKHAGRNMK